MEDIQHISSHQQLGDQTGGGGIGSGGGGGGKLAGKTLTSSTLKRIKSLIRPANHNTFPSPSIKISESITSDNLAAQQQGNDDGASTVVMETTTTREKSKSFSSPHETSTTTTTTTDNDNSLHSSISSMLSASSCPLTSKLSYGGSGGCGATADDISPRTSIYLYSNHSRSSTISSSSSSSHFSTINNNHNNNHNNLNSSNNSVHNRRASPSNGSFLKYFLPSMSSPASPRTSSNSKRNSITPVNPLHRSISVINLKNEMIDDMMSVGTNSNSPSPRTRSQSDVVMPSWESFSFEGDFTNAINETLQRALSQPHVRASLSASNTSDDFRHDLEQQDSSQGAVVEQQPSSDKGLVFDHQSNNIVAGTIDRIVGLLTDITSYTGTQYVEDVLYTYHYYIKDFELLEKLWHRFDHPLEGTTVSPTATTKEIDQITNHIKFRVINVLKKWVEGHGYDFSSSPALYRPFMQFLESITRFNAKWGNHMRKSVSVHVVRYINAQTTRDSSSQSLRELVPLHDAETLATIMMRALPLKERKKKLRTIRSTFLGNEAIDWLVNRYELNLREDAIDALANMLKADLIRHHSDRKSESFKDKDTVYFFTKDNINGSGSGANDSEYPDVIMPKQLLPTSTFLDVHPVEIARQLTLIEFTLYCKITPSDLHHQAWSKQDAADKVPNIMAFIKRSNSVSYWVATEILLERNIKQRMTVVKRFITIAEILLKLNNWNTLMGIMLGLNLGSIQRLKKTWEGLPKNMLDSFEQLTLQTSASQNYANYRKAMSNPSFPCLPYLAVYLRDLTYIEDANQDCTDSGYINFSKMQMISKVLTEIHRFQSVPYLLKKVDPISKMLTQTLILSDKDLYKASNICEQPTRTLTMSSMNNPKTLERKKSFFPTLKKDKDREKDRDKSLN